MILPRLNYITTSQSEDFVNDVTFSPVLDDLQDMVTVVSQFDNVFHFEDVGLVSERTVENFVSRGLGIESKSLNAVDEWDKWFYFGLGLGGLWFLMSLLKLIQGKIIIHYIGTVNDIYSYDRLVLLYPAC